jgi:hypothetical protein
MRSRKKPATGGRATGYSYSLVLQDNDQPNLIVPVSWSGRSVLLCTDCGVAGSLLIPPGDFISPDHGPLRPFIWNLPELN